VTTGSDQSVYEAPAIVILGAISQLTLGGDPGESGDGSATYLPIISDARLKQRVRRLPDALSRLHRLGELTGR
jgi:hypothetical protein